MGMNGKSSKKRKLQSNPELDRASVRKSSKKGSKKSEKEMIISEHSNSEGDDFSISEDGESDLGMSEGGDFSGSEERELVDEDNNAEQADVQNGAEMEELEREYSNLRDREEDLLKSLQNSKNEDFLKGQAVKNQKALWDKALELRILLQKAFSSSNKLPQEPLRSSFHASNKKVDQAYSDLLTSSEQTLNCFLELQEVLLEKNPLVQASATGMTKEYFEDPNESNISDREIDETWLQIHKMHCRIAPFRDSSIDKWQRKSQVATGAAAFKGKLQAFNQTISQQVATYMRDPSKMIKRMQLRRSSVGIFGQDLEPGNVKEEDLNAEVDPELLDDSDFYQQLLKEFLESFDPSSSGTNIDALKKLQAKKRKIVDRRASKSRKIRYHVHEKIVNFMAPVKVEPPEMAAKLFENLFGLQSRKSALVG